MTDPMKVLAENVAAISLFLAITGGWVLIGAVVVLIGRLTSIDMPADENVFGGTAVGLFILMHVAFFIALFHYRSLDS